jgi:hypothetical protein
MGTVDRFRDAIGQNENEFRLFLALLRAEKVHSYLEIGSRYGGSLWRLAPILPDGARMIAVDFPDSMGGRSDSKESLCACVAELRACGYDAGAIFGDSTDPVIVEMVRMHGPYDAVFIDANHSLEFVTADWNNYRAMARIVAFHDIGWKRKDEWCGKRIEVPILWDQIKQDYPYVEIKFERKNNGIGVIWTR